MDTLTQMPDAFTAGTTVKYTRTYSDFPAASWTLTVYLAGACVTEPITASESGGIYSITLPASVTAALDPGQYTWEERASNASGEIYVAARGSVSVSQDIAAAGAGDMQSKAEQELAVVEAAIAGRLTDAMEEFTIAGRAVKYIPMKDLLSIRASLKAQIAAAKNPGTFMREVRAQFTGYANEAP